PSSLRTSRNLRRHRQLQNLSNPQPPRVYARVGLPYRRHHLPRMLAWIAAAGDAPQGVSRSHDPVIEARRRRDRLGGLDDGRIYPDQIRLVLSPQPPPRGHEHRHDDDERKSGREITHRAHPPCKCGAWHPALPSLTITTE